MYVAGGVSLLIRVEGSPAGAWALCVGVAVFLIAVTVAQAQATDDRITRRRSRGRAVTDSIHRAAEVHAPPPYAKATLGAEDEQVSGA